MQTRTSAGLWLAGAVSLAVHAGLVVVAQAQPAGLTPAAVPPARSAARLEIRVASTAGSQPLAIGFSDADAPAVDEANLAPAPVAPPAETPVLPDGAGQSAPIQMPETGRREQPAVDPAATYLPRSSLSRPPAPLGEIVLAWPRDALVPNDRLTGIFWLYIGETGDVDRIQPDDSTLTPQLQEVARSAFLAARFEPGQVDGRAVKSLIKIEVEFDNRPAATPAATVAAQRQL